jgi:NAD(P)-dependent dehydrogenase (short-subunit alcohol dehydrogenase family)
MVHSLFDLDSKVAVVTGGGRGIGRGIALEFAEAGADVAVLARTQSEIDAVAEEIKAKGRKALAVRTDVTKAGEVKDAVEEIKRTYGRIDVWVNNAGGEVGLVSSTPAEGYAVPLLSISEEEWDDIVNLNLKASFLCAKEAGPVMIDGGKGGSIINIGSMASLVSKRGYAHYSAAKAGLISLTLTLADEWASQKIRANAVIVGCVNTPTVNWEESMFDPMMRQIVLANISLNRWGQPADVARACLFFASEASSYITGARLEIAGGLGMHM